MNCQQIREAMEAFMNGKLRGEESREVRRHLASCDACSSRLSPSEWMEILPALDEEIEPTEDFSSRFHARLQERRSHRIPWWRKISAWGRPWQLAAAGALALALVGIFLVRYLGEPTDQAEYADIAVAEDLPFFDDMAIISNLDLLEDFDIIENLDLRPEGSKIQRSNP